MSRRVPPVKAFRRITLPECSSVAPTAGASLLARTIADLADTALTL
ncbi:MAG TPA: hypothetical protein VMU81_11965 [Acetobacteraceae bacterium]|jgi:hypothetical protein|nr:hypothetical protein [Acetobacteraceae bacterium]